MKHMTKRTEERPGELEQFVKEMGTVNSLGKSITESKEDQRSSVRGKAVKALRQTAYDYLVKKGDINPASDPTAKDAKTYGRANPDRVNETVELLYGTSLRNSSNLLEKHTDTILGGISPKGLEKIAGSPQLAEATTDKLRGWYTGYQEIAQSIKQAEELAERAKKGKDKLSKEERELLLAPAAKVRGEEVKKKFIEEHGYDADADADLVDARVALAQSNVLLGYTGKDLLAKGAAELVKAKRTELTAYEEKTKMNVRSYVSEALKGLVKGKTKEFDLARSLVYEAAK